MPKLAAILLVPVVAIGLLTWLRLQDELAAVHTLDTIHRGRELADQAAAVATALQGERNAAVAFIAGGRVGGSSADEAARSRDVDAAADAFRTAAGAMDTLDPGVQAAVRSSLADLDSLTAIRSAVMSTRYPDSSAFTSYSTISAGLGQVTRAVAGSISDPSAAPLAEALRALADSQEQLTEQSALLLSAAHRGRFPPGQVAALRAAQSGFDAAQTSFGQVASADDRQRLQNVVAGPQVDDFTQLAQQALLQDGASQPITISAAAAQRDGEGTAALVRQVAAGVDHELDQAIAQLSAAAVGRAWRDGVAVVAFVLIALVVMLLVARSLLKPLGLLRRTALDTAHHRLPAAIAQILSTTGAISDVRHALPSVPIHTREEVGQLARAFDVVLREAVRLASEQAALRGNVNTMFVNLSRRSQNLTHRQIEVLDRLEQDEQDPDRLADLFELDHLATRARRNSENLLVLAGAPPDQRIVQPVAMEDVFGGAVSEVEQYARITVVAAPDAAVQSRAAKDLVHLLAELLENATDYSPPSTTVTVRSIVTRSGALRIEVHDRGVGMDEEEIDRANDRLAEPPAVDVTVSRQMGLYVVGQLARRHGVAVSLRANLDIDGGTTAQILVPSDLVEPLTRPSAMAMPAAPRREPDEPSGPTTASSLFTPQLPAWDDRAGADAQWLQAADPAATLSIPLQVNAPSVPDDEATGRLPIYQEVISRWFADDNFPLSTDDDLPATTAVNHPDTSTMDHRPINSEPEAAPPTATTSALQELPSWSSPGDTGWLTAKAVLEQPPVPDSTAAGLPKRVPKAHLIPGSAMPREAAASAEPPQRPDPTRLAAFQRSANEGRHALASSDTTHREQP